jgi:nitroreductase
MDTYHAITTRRTIRLFDQKPISPAMIERMLNAGRLAPSAANRQVLEFIVVQEAANREKLFQHLKWAAYVQPKRNPAAGQRPTAYIIVLVRGEETNWLSASDASAAMENTILTAWNEGVGSCWLASVDREKAQAELNIPETHNIFGVLAMGYPAEKPVEEKLTDSIKYWLDEDDRLHVPKRRLCEILHYETFEDRATCEEK